MPKPMHFASHIWSVYSVTSKKFDGMADGCGDLFVGMFRDRLHIEPNYVTRPPGPGTCPCLSVCLNGEQQNQADFGDDPLCAGDGSKTRVCVGAMANRR